MAISTSLVVHDDIELHAWHASPGQWHKRVCGLAARARPGLRLREQDLQHSPLVQRRKFRRPKQVDNQYGRSRLNAESLAVSSAQHVPSDPTTHSAAVHFPPSPLSTRRLESNATDATGYESDPLDNSHLMPYSLTQTIDRSDDEYFRSVFAQNPNPSRSQLRSMYTTRRVGRQDVVVRTRLTEMWKEALIVTCRIGFEVQERRRARSTECAT